MLGFTARLKSTSRPRGEPSAWFVPGAGAELWLEELELWEVSLGSVKLYPVARSVLDSRAFTVKVGDFQLSVQAATEQSRLISSNSSTFLALLCIAPPSDLRSIQRGTIVLRVGPIQARRNGSK